MMTVTISTWYNDEPIPRKTRIMAVTVDRIVQFIQNNGHTLEPNFEERLRGMLAELKDQNVQTNFEERVRGILTELRDQNAQTNNNYLEPEE